MKRLSGWLAPAILGAALICAASLSACGTGGSTSPSSVTASVSIDATKAMIAAEAAYNAAKTAEVQAKGSGLLTGAKAVQADALMSQAYADLLTARAVYNAGTSPDTTALLALTNQVLALVTAAPSSS